MNETSNYNEVMRIGVRTPNLTRRSCFKRITLAAGVILLLTFLDASGEDAPDRVPPKGLRILYGGDSWHRFMPHYAARIANAADIKGHSIHWGDPPRKDIVELYSKGEIDVHSWGRPGWSSDKLSQIVDPKPIEAGLKGNPNYRVYLQMAWIVGDGLGGRVKVKDDYDNSKIEEVQAILDRERAKVEAVADELNKKYGRQFFYLVPLGDATTKLRAMIVEGKFPGVTKQSAIFADAMPHAGPIAAELAAYCNYAAIYRTSPVGLQIKDGVPEEQRVILQKLAWETVSKYPYAGVAKYDVSARSDVAGNAAPAAGVVAPAKAEALKGWNATQDLPDDTVVTDYNDYIERLPKAERPGVSDVKYYVDGTGRNAVAVLVNAGGAQWTHLLVYDKQNKRTGVTRFVAGK